jgi:hypothetical protein
MARLALMFGPVARFYGVSGGIVPLLFPIFVLALTARVSGQGAFADLRQISSGSEGRFESTSGLLWERFPFHTGRTTSSPLGP